MARLLLMSSLLLVSCGVPSALEKVPAVVTLGPYDTAAGVLANLGEPCRQRPQGGGTEAWDYCGRECPPPGIARECVEPCAGDCPSGWTFYLTAGVVVRYELWGME